MLAGQRRCAIYEHLYLHKAEQYKRKKEHNTQMVIK